MVRRDEEGCLFYEGRADDIISSAGYRIGPMEVENALAEHPAVQESAAVGKPDAECGEIESVAELPTNASGKLLRRVLRAR